jgi:UDP-2,3-diacylglucosamine hydrolase
MSGRGYKPQSSLNLLEQLRRRHDLDPVGLVAGWGKFPVEVARHLIASGRSVCCIAILGHADPQLETLCDHVRWSGVGKIGAHVRYFRKHGIRQVAMAGKLFKADILYQGPVILKHLPDWTALRTFGPLLFGRQRDARDDRLLTAVTETYTRAGITVCPATDFAPELLVKEGSLAGPPVSPKIESDIQRGWAIAKAMGGMDIGQTITIKDGSVIAVEAIEGTDACIQRTGTLCRRGGWTMVKVSKPNQDMRFDVPTIGPQTIEMVAAAGGKAIAIEADMTIMVDQAATLAAAKKAGISIIALRNEATRAVA